MWSVIRRKMCNLTCKKLVMLVAAGLTVTTFSCYLMFFNHGPPEDIMQANRYRKDSSRLFADKKIEHLDELEKDVHLEEKEAYEYWQDFITRNHFTAIGEVYDNCDENNRKMVGRTIMLPERRWGGIKGVKSRTFINTTLESEVTDGRFYLDVQYNGKDIYSKDWELCTLDEDYDDAERIVHCPFNPGDFSVQKDKSIPIYLPKGRYTTKGRITDQDGEVLLCGFSDFTL